MSEPSSIIQLKALAVLHRLADRKFQHFLIVDPSDPAYELSWEAYKMANRDYWTYAQYLHTQPTQGSSNA